MKIVASNLAKSAAPRIKVAGGRLEIEWGDAAGHGLSSRRIAAIAAFVDPDAMTAKLRQAIDALPGTGSALSAEERPIRLDELTSELDDLERREEALIEAALAKRQTVDAPREGRADRRPRHPIEQRSSEDGGMSFPAVTCRPKGERKSRVARKSETSTARGCPGWSTRRDLDTPLQAYNGFSKPPPSATRPRLRKPRVCRRAGHDASNPAAATLSRFVSAR